MADWLVHRITNRGARVRTVSTAEAVGVSECRMALDGMIAAKAAPHATDAEVAAPRVDALRMRQAAQAGELTRRRRPGPT